MASDLKGDPTTGEDMETRYKICHFHRFAYMAERCLLCEMQEAIDRTAAQNRALLAALEALAEACEDVNNPTGLDRAYNTARAVIVATKGETK